MEKEESKTNPEVLKFRFLESEKKSTIIESPTPNCTARDAIEAAGLENFSFEDHILFAEVNDGVVASEVSVSPGILCQKLKQDKKIRGKKRKGVSPKTREIKNRTDDVNEAEDKENRKPGKEQILFYVDSTNPGITKIPNTAYEGKPLCVIVEVNDTLKDAISKDGRFANVELMMYENDRQSEIRMHYLASHYSGKVLSMRKRPPKRKKEEKPGSDEGQCSETADENPSMKSVFSLPDNLTDPFTEDMGRAMVNDARRNALETFAKPGAKGDPDYHIRRTVQEFGKKDSSSLPASILDTLAEAKKSVAYLHCGDYAATCWLLTENTIITSRHVIRQIVTLRSEATDPNVHRTIFVDFHYDHPEQHGELQAEIDEEQEELSGQGTLDYAICYLKPSPVLVDLRPLGFLVRRPLPRSGRVALVAHPEKQFKKLEICKIIPAYAWQETLRGRASEAVHYCERNPEECKLTASHMHFDEIVECYCIHMYDDNIFEPPDHSQQVPYDTSFFHGASGSPVFNAYGHIVAMHTMGYPFSQGNKKVSLMEFGITFAAIFRDIKERYGNDIANSLFPHAL